MRMRYAYLVVGAGSAGATLAGRLSDDPTCAVLLVEAGPDYRSADAPPEVRLANTLLIFKPENAALWWSGIKARHTTAQPLAPGYQRGRGVGGSSAINAMAAIRGLPEDYDGWAADGCRGWAWEDVLPAFIRLEDDHDFGDAPYHGRAGPIPIARTPRAAWGPLSEAVGAAALALGYGWADDHNRPDATGVSPFALNGRDGVRVSTSDAYLEPARQRTNLTILGDTLVDRVVFAGRRAIGVRARTPQGWTELEADEILLCAGTIHSPAILMRSGVGPADHLQALGIPVVHAAPAVGRNLSDHAAVDLTVPLRPEGQVASRQDRHINCCVRYSSGLVGAGRNDMMLIPWNLDGSDRDRGMITLSQFQTLSRGTLSLESPDPAADPLLDLCLLSDDRDLVRMRDGVKRLAQIARHPTVRRLTQAHALESSLEPLHLEATDEAIDEWLMATCGTTGHPCGTCRMGAPDSARAVVDPAGRVIGVEGLRIADAAIMPEVPRANNHLSCVMVGEHLAAILRAERSG
jgi:choline dehydrogenase